MPSDMPGSGQIDPHLLEARTQAIGRELFSAARAHAARLSALNRWTQQILAWCLADPAVKANVLRLLDVLPGLETPASVARHVVEYFPTEQARLPAALRLGATVARGGTLGAAGLAAVVRQSVEQVARQFIAEPGPSGAAHTLRALAQQGATCSVDVLGEQVLSEAEADAYARQYLQVVDDLAAAAGAPEAERVRVCGPRLDVSIKPTALTPRFDPLCQEASLDAALRRLLPIAERAAGLGVRVTLDMEQREVRDLTLELARRLLVHPALRHGQLGIVLQAYLRDAEPSLDEVLQWLTRHERGLTVRLVKGAYWDYEVAQARRFHWPAPVHEEKPATDAAFERLTERLLGAHPLVTTAVASHNVRSVAHAMAVAELRGMERTELEFQLLYGMGESLQAAILGRGYPVRVYTPMGPLIPGMAYLVRRLLENTANESFLRQDWTQERSVEDLLRPPRVPDEPPRTTGWTGWTGETWMDPASAAQRLALAEALQARRQEFGRVYPVLLGRGPLETPDRLPVRNPAHPQDLLGHVCAASPAIVREAVAQASAAQRAWGAQPVAARTECLRRAAALLRARRWTLAAWEVLEVGKPWREADADLVEAISFLEYYSEQMEQLAAGRPLPHVPGERNTYTYVPRGLAVVIAPWNFPLAIPLGMTAAALAAGNAVLLKPAEQSPLIAWHLVQLLREAGVPPAVLQLLPGLGPEVGAALVRHPDTHVTLFTGSKTVGLDILRASAQVGASQRFVKHVVAEMGGKNAIVVDDDADLDAVIQGVCTSAFSYAGQKCSAASRLIVHAALYDRLIARLTAAVDRLVVGDPADPATEMGPLIEASAQQRLRDAATQAQSVGRVLYRYPEARLPREGFFVGPWLVGEVPQGHGLAQEELFGPLLCVFRVSTFGDGLALANGTGYALTGGVYSRSPAHIRLARRAFDVGNLYINRPITGAVVGRQPFGGHRLSGLGTKAGGPDYLLEVLLPKTITENTARHGMPLED